MVKKVQKIKEDVFDVIVSDINKLFRDITKTIDKRVNQTVSNAIIQFKNPRSDITQNPKNVELNIHLPGINKKDILLNITKDHVEITAESSKFKKLRSKSKYLEQRESKGYHRIIPLSPDLDTDNTKAYFSNDTLKLIIPKLKKKPHKPLIIR